LVRYFVDGKAKSLRATTLKQARSKSKKALESVSSGTAQVRGLLTPQQMAAVAKFHERNERLDLPEGYKNDCRKHLEMLGKMLDDSIIQSIRQPELTECLEGLRQVVVHASVGR
jgi:hypothetical protein